MVNTQLTPLGGKQLGQLADDSSEHTFVACPADFERPLHAVHLFLVEIPLPDRESRRGHSFFPVVLGFLSCGCCDKSLQTWWLMTPRMCSFRFRRSEVWGGSQWARSGYRQGRVSSGAFRRQPVFLPFPAFGGSPHPLPRTLPSSKPRVSSRVFLRMPSLV